LNTFNTVSVTVARVTEIVILSGFGLIWLSAPKLPVPPWLVIPAGVLIAAALVFAAYKRGMSGNQAIAKNAWRIYGIVNILQVIAIFATVSIAGRSGHGDLIPSIIAIIVGAHFLPFAKPFGRPEYLVTAALLIAAGAIGLFAGPVFTGLACAAVLWGTAVYRIRQSSPVTA
jgi:uncharacterized membrane protein